jgi:hypothetical protein
VGTEGNNTIFFPVHSLFTCKAGDFDAQMSGIKIKKGNEILRPVYKKPFSEILSGCFHFGLFSS